MRRPIDWQLPVASAVGGEHRGATDSNVGSVRHGSAADEARGRETSVRRGWSASIRPSGMRLRFQRECVRHSVGESFADSCGRAASCRRSCDVPTDSRAASERYPSGVRPSVHDVTTRSPLSSQSGSDRASSSSPRGGVSVLAHFGFLRRSEGRLHSLVSRGGRQAFPSDTCAKVGTSLALSVAVHHCHDGGHFRTNPSAFTTSNGNRLLAISARPTVKYALATFLSSSEYRCGGNAITKRFAGKYCRTATTGPIRSLPVPRRAVLRLAKTDVTA